MIELIRRQQTLLRPARHAAQPAIIDALRGGIEAGRRSWAAIGNPLPRHHEQTLAPFCIPTTASRTPKRQLNA